MTTIKDVWTSVFLYHIQVLTIQPISVYFSARHLLIITTKITYVFTTVNKQVTLLTHQQGNVSAAVQMLQGKLRMVTKLLEDVH
jgi:hypothetical protein